MPPPAPDDALAVVTDPHSVGLHPALMTNAWARLKEARGQPLRRTEMLQPAHIIGPPACGTVVTIGQACTRVATRVREMMAARALPTGGDAA